MLRGLRALDARRRWLRISVRLITSMRWVPAEPGIKTEKNVFLRNPPGRARFQISMRLKISMRWVPPGPGPQLARTHDKKKVQVCDFVLEFVDFRGDFYRNFKMIRYFAEHCEEL